MKDTMLIISSAIALIGIIYAIYSLIKILIIIKKDKQIKEYLENKKCKEEIK